MNSQVSKACAIVVVLAMALVLAAPAVGAAKQPAGRTPPEGVSAQGVTAQDRWGKDAYESADNTWTTAPTLPAVSYHTLHSVDGAITDTMDVDWFKVTVTETDTPIYIHGRRLGGMYFDLWLDVFFDDGTGKPEDTRSYADDDTVWPYWGGSTTGMPRAYFVAPAPGTYWFRIAEIDLVAGNPLRDIVPTPEDGACSYELWVSKGGAARVAGADRYKTSAAVSRLMWPESDTYYWETPPDGDGVIVASGASYPDAIAAGALSVDSGLPVLLTRPGALPTEIAAEVHRLATGVYWDGDDFTVYICGGESAVSKNVYMALAADPFVSDIERLAGGTRAGTAASIADEMGGSTAVFLANGWSFADILSAGPVAGWAGEPILLCSSGSVPQETLDWMVANGVTDVTVCGGTLAIAESVLTKIQNEVPGVQTFERIAGADRYETSYEMAAFGVDEHGMNPGMPIVVSGEGFADGMSAAQLSYFTGGPVLLTPSGALSPWVKDFYDDYGPFDDAVYVVGGPAAVGPAAFKTLNDMWKTP